MNPKELKAVDVMTPDPVTVQANLPLPELGAFLFEHQISGAPVVDEHGCLVGVVSVSDLARAAGLLVGDETEHQGDGFFRPEPLQLVVGCNPTLGIEPAPKFEGNLADHRVAEIMSTLIYSVSEETRVSEIARIMISHRYHRVLVTRDDQLLGIVTSLDLAALLLTELDRASLLLESDRSTASVAC
ncbi:MAG: CBS domain-containing protein [Thermoanaerobaculia bacterium]|nr:CBS domain-containing protein [Thermoanaerobaculia bacterium]